MENASKILIVEDDPSISDLLEMNFSVAGYCCDAANNGKDALERIRKNAYDLAVLDIMLPGIDGFELFQDMQEKQIPIIYLSAKSDTHSKVKGLKMGAEDYITKPFDVLELLVRVEKVLQRYQKKQREHRQTIYQIGNVTVREQEHMVLQNGVPVELKPMEYALLLMLVKHPNMVFSREQLLDEVWGEAYLGESRTVDNHIAILRKKLNWGDTIVTVHRIGYKLAGGR